MNKTKVYYEFEGYRLDIAAKCLWRDNELVSLTPKALETLTVLVRHRGAVVEKDVLLNEVWADTFVEEATLAQNISTLRRILGAQPGRPFIETVPRRGYRFVADVHEVAAEEELFVVEKRSRTDITSKTEIIDGPAHQTRDDGYSLERRQDGVAAEKPIASKKRAVRKTSIYVGGAAVFGLAAVAGVWYFFFSASLMADTQFQKLRFSNLTSSSNLMRVSVSPDAKYLAIAERRQNEWVLLVRQIDSASKVEVTPPASSQFIGFTFSGDGQLIYYSAYPQPVDSASVRYGKLYKVPLLGGVPEEIKHDIDSAITISPKNSEYAFVRNAPAENRSQIIVAQFKDGAERVLASRTGRDPYICPAPAWSPDGKTIICSVNSATKKRKAQELVTIDVGTGTETVLSTEFQWVGQAAWLKDGSGVVFPAFRFDSPGLTDEIWCLSFPGGRLRSITNGIGGYYGIGLSADSNSLVAIKALRSSNFWLQPIANHARVEARALHRGLSEMGLMQTAAWPAGQGILFDSTRNGDSDIWKTDPVDGKQTQLTTDDAADYSPAASPDGTFAVFLSNRSGSTNIWRMKLDGTDVRRLTDLSISVESGISTDGKWVYFSSRGEEGMFPMIWKVPANGGEPVQLTYTRGTMPKVSPDGKFIACRCTGPDQQSGMRLTILSAETGTLIKQFAKPQGRVYLEFSWSADSQNLYVLQFEPGSSVIAKLPLSGGPATYLVESRGEQIFRFAVSADGQSLFYENGNYFRDVLMLTNIP